jgi:hypothetical protein
VYKYCILHRLLFLQIVYTILFFIFSFVEIYSASKNDGLCFKGFSSYILVPFDIFF